MKSAPRLRVGWSPEDKHEIVHLQKQNAALRTQLKSLGSKITGLIQIKDASSSKRNPIHVPPEEELKELHKLIDIYKKEKRSLSNRLKKALDLDYFNKLAEKVEKTSQKLNQFESQKKITEFYEKKETLYKQTQIKPVDTAAELSYFNSKKHDYLEKIKEMEEGLEKSGKNIKNSTKRLKALENEYKDLLNELGEPYFREKSQRKLKETIQKKKQIENSITKESNSKLNLMQLKIKTLQNELKASKEVEHEIYTQLLTLSKQVEQNSLRIRKSPIFMNNISLLENRSRSVKPNLKGLLHNISY